MATPLHTCILLLYGIPGAGKTLMSRDLATHWNTSLCNFVHVCCDDHYPPDLRLTGDNDDAGNQFRLKSARRDIIFNVERCLNINGHCEKGGGDRGDKSDDDKWTNFITAVKERSLHSIDTNGRSVNDHGTSGYNQTS